MIVCVFIGFRARSIVPVCFGCIMFVHWIACITIVCTVCTMAASRLRCTRSAHAAARSGVVCLLRPRVPLPGRSGIVCLPRPRVPLPSRSGVVCLPRPRVPLPRGSGVVCLPRPRVPLPRRSGIVCLLRPRIPLPATCLVRLATNLGGGTLFLRGFRAVPSRATLCPETRKRVRTRQALLRCLSLSENGPRPR